MDQVIWERLAQETDGKLDEAVIRDALSEYENSKAPKQIEYLNADIKETKRALQEAEEEHAEILKAFGKKAGKKPPKGVKEKAKVLRKKMNKCMKELFKSAKPTKPKTVD